jgi:hypothetical protein
MTNNNSSLESNILDELFKTGYPTEIVSAEIMQKKGWGVLHNPSYLDDTEKISREYDIRAFRSWKYVLPGGDQFIGVYLLVECKKSEKPWVFFSTPEKYDSWLGQFIKSPDRHIFSSYYSSDCYIPDSTLREFHHYFQSPRLARTYHEPFKGHEKSDNSSQMIFTAVMSTVKATLFHIQDRRGDNWTPIYYPMIVFDGNLFEALVNSKDEIELVPSEHLQLAFDYMIPTRGTRVSIWEQQKRFIIDVVRADYLAEFLKKLEKEHAHMAKCIRDKFFDDYVENDEQGG